MENEVTKTHNSKASEKQIQGPKVLDFTNYRSFLVAHFEYRKKLSPSWSFAVWARILGLKNNTSLLKILNGNRNAGPDIQERLVKYFKFSQKERNYFSDLVLLEKISETSSLRSDLIERLSLHHRSGKFQVLTSEQFSVLSDWWCYAIRQLAKNETIEFDAGEISKRLRFDVGPKRVTSAVKRMINLNLLALNSANQLRSTETTLRTSQDVASESIKRFHESSFDNCRQSVRATPIAEREFGALVLPFASKDLPEAKAFLRQVIEQFDARFGNQATTESVYQLQLALIPLTENLKKKGIKNEN